MKNDHNIAEKSRLNPVEKIGFWRITMIQNTLFSRGVSRLTQMSLLLLIIGFLSACDKVDNPDAPPEVVTRSSTAADVEVEYFQDNFYNNIMALNCRNCHTRGGTGTGEFADDNVNTAYAAATSMIPSLPLSGSPDTTIFVVQVAADHNCWSGNCANDATAISGWIQA